MRKLIETDFELMLRQGELMVPPLEIHVVDNTSDRDREIDALLDITWRGRTCRFVAELKRDAKPITLKNAIDQVRNLATKSGRGRPLVVMPYLSSEKLDQVLDAGVSAIDFSGNAAIDACGEFYFYKTGNPNRFSDSSPIRSAYRGDGSLVARVLLLEREFQAVNDILKSIRTRGGSLTLGMVSKVLQRLEADLAIERPDRNTVRVIQVERILDGLLEAYQTPKAQSRWLGKVNLPPAVLLAKLREVADDCGVVRSGESSAGSYATWAGEPIISCYCRVSPDVLFGRLGAEAKETRGFANLRLTQTQDQLVYFDARPGLSASPIQAWLEMASGDKRQKEVAEQIRSTILNSTGPDA